MNKKIPNPFNIPLSEQETFILRSCDENYTVYGLAYTRRFDIYSEDMRHLGTVEVDCSEEKGHEIISHNLDAVWEEAVDCIEEKDFRAAIKNSVTTYHTKRFV